MNTNLMKRMLPRVMLVGVCAGLSLATMQAQQTPAPPAAPSPPPAAAPPSPPVKKQPAVAMQPFLGVVVSAPDETLTAQLDLPEGTGLLVRAVMEDSPAARAGMQQHDVLHLFNDQILVNEPQLQTLVRQAGAGTEVKLTLLRRGRSEVITVKLGEHAEPKPLAEWPHGGGGVLKLPMQPGASFPGFHFDVKPPVNGIPGWDGEAFNRQVRDLRERIEQSKGNAAKVREEVERFQQKMQELVKKNAGAAAKGGAAARSEARTVVSTGNGEGGIRVQVITEDGKVTGAMPGIVTATSDGQGNVVVSQSTNTRMTWSDADGSGELITEDGSKKLTVKDRKGKVIFTGPVDTEEQRKKLPEEVRTRLERIEGGVKVEVRPAAPGEDS